MNGATENKKDYYKIISKMHIVSTIYRQKGIKIRLSILNMNDSNAGWHITEEIIFIYSVLLGVRKKQFIYVCSNLGF